MRVWIWIRTGLGPRSTGRFRRAKETIPLLLLLLPETEKSAHDEEEADGQQPQQQTAVAMPGDHTDITCAPCHAAMLLATS